MTKQIMHLSPGGPGEVAGAPAPPAVAPAAAPAAASQTTPEAPSVLEHFGGQVTLTEVPPASATTLNAPPVAPAAAPAAGTTTDQGTSPVVPPAAQPAAPTTTALSPQDLRDLVEQRYGARVAIPAEAKTVEDVFLALEQSLTPKLHPDALRLNATLEKGGTLTQFVDQVTAVDRMLQLPNADLVKQHLQGVHGKSDANPQGMTPEEVSAAIAEMTPGTLALKSAEIRKELVVLKQKQDQEAQQQYRGTQVDLSDPTARQAYQSAVTTKATEALKVDSLYGIPISDAETKTKLVARATELFMPDAKTGQSEMDRLLQSDPIGLALAYDMAKSGTFTVERQRAVEKGKNIYLDILALSPPAAPNEQGGGQQVSTQQALDGFGARPGLIT